MAFFMDIIRDSRRRLAPRHEFGPIQGAEAVAGYSGTDDAPIPVPPAAGQRPHPARLGSVSGKPLDQANRDLRMDEGGGQESSPESRASEALAASLEPRSWSEWMGEARGSRQRTVSGPVSEGGGSPALQRKPLVLPSGTGDGPDRSGRSLTQGAPAGIGLGGNEGGPTGVPMDSHVPPVSGERQRMLAPEGMPASALPLDRSALETRSPEKSGVDRHDPAREEIREMATGEPLSLPERALESRPAADFKAGRPVVAADSQGTATGSESGLPQVRIGKVNVIVESVRETRKPSSLTGQGDDLASRTFLRSL